MQEKQTHPTAGRMAAAMRQNSTYGYKMGWAGGLHETADRQLSSAITQWSAWKKKVKV